MVSVISVIFVMIFLICLKKDADREALYKKNHPELKENEEKKEDDTPEWIKHPNTVLFTDSSFGF